MNEERRQQNRNEHRTHMEAVERAWEKADLKAGGLYSANLREIARHHPKLTPTELKVCAMVKANKTTMQIGEMLGIRDKTIEIHRGHSRKKLGVENGLLLSFLNRIDLKEK